MIDKMRELTDGQMQEFVKVLEKRRVPLHSVLIAQHGKLIFEKYSYCWSRRRRSRGLFNNTTDKYVRANLELTWIYR